MVLHDLSPGGTERVALRLAARWAALGRGVTLMVGDRCGALEPLLAAAEVAGVEAVACAPAVPRGRGARARLGAAAAGLLDEQPHRVLFVPGNHHWPVVPPVARLPDGTRPAVVVQVSNPLRRPGRGALAQAVFELGARRRLRGADAAVCLSEAAVAETDRLFGRPVAVRIALPALEDDAPPPVPVPAGPPLVLAAGRLAPQKDFGTALEAFARVDAPGARLAIVGEGPLRGELLARAAALGLADRVELPGHVSDLRPWLDRAALLLLTSRYEGYGAVVVEALAAGRPVVATNCTPAASELLDRPGRGRVAPVGDAPALARGVEAVLAAPPAAGAELAAGVQGHRIGPVARAYLDLFDRASAARPRG